jgi:hypothetical protein
VATTYQNLIDDVCGWLNRRDILPRIPSWVAMVETEMAETLRARCMVTSTEQDINAYAITLPFDFATMASIRDATSGEMLELKDEWSGHWTGPGTSAWVDGAVVGAVGQVCTAYRLVHDCIEFLPHPVIPDPVDPTHVWQRVMMNYYAKPRPLVAPTDTNPILEQLYAVYLWGVIKNGALFELDDDRAAQADAMFQQVVTRANNWKQFSDYSGAPLRSELVTFG